MTPDWPGRMQDVLIHSALNAMKVIFIMSFLRSSCHTRQISAPLNTFRGILKWQLSAPPSSKHDKREYLSGERCSSLQSGNRDMENLWRGALKLLRWLVVAENVIKSPFPLYLSPGLHNVYIVVLVVWCGICVQLNTLTIWLISASGTNWCYNLFFFLHLLHIQTAKPSHLVRVCVCEHAVT